MDISDWRMDLFARYAPSIRLFHVNEFYKKGCQEKTSPSTGERVSCLDLQPTVYAIAPPIRSEVLLWTVLPSRGFLCRWRQCQSGRRDFASEIDVCVVIMVLSEARGLSLFLIIRGG